MGNKQSSRMTRNLRAAKEVSEGALKKEGRDIPARPAPPEPMQIIEPGDWNKSDPSYSALVQQVVGKITTRPTEVSGHKILNDVEVPSMVTKRGKLNLAELKFLLNSYEKELSDESVKRLAEKYNLDLDSLRQVLKSLSKPVDFGDSKANPIP